MGPQNRGGFLIIQNIVFSDTLIVNSGNDILNGGAGIDDMRGGRGNDTYIVDNSNDVIKEGSDKGTDLVQSSITYILSNNLENLTLTGFADINGTGNAADNVLSGNEGDNNLDGDLGIDDMRGGIGDDTYIVDNEDDIVRENANQGTDSVQSSVNYILSNNVENLTLRGSADNHGTGNY